MRILVNEQLSQHKYKTPEGYLICADAIIARTGKQEYRRNEIFADSDDDSVIELDRPAEEVFDDKTIASFENKPLVNEHPDEDVNVTNHKDYAIGFVRDVRKGTVNGQDVLLANLVVTDEEAIKEIESGEKTELSCGYDCDIVDEKNPRQTNIRGNHVALCERGRAGIAKIVDSVKDDRYIIMRKSGAGEEIYTSDNKQDVLDELNSLGRNYMVYDNKTKKTYSIKEFKSTSDSVKDDFEIKLENGTVIKPQQRRDITEEIFDIVKKYHQKGYDFIEIKNEVDIYIRNAYNRRASDRELEEAIEKAYKKFGYSLDDNMKDSIKDGRFIYVWVDKKDIKKSKYDVFEYAKANDVDVTDLGTEYRFEGEYDDVDYLFDELNLDVNDYDFDDSISDSIQDVNPRSGESKEEFISRFMSETKNEYPDEKQRLAVAYSYWEKGKGKNSMIKDSLTRQERELCDYMLENTYERGMKPEDLLRKMRVYYSAYASLARSKPDEVLDYFEEEIENGMYDSVKDSKVKDYDEDSFFTREDLIEFEDELERKLGHNAKVRAYIDGKKLSVDYELDGDSSFKPAEVIIDMRKIRNPEKDLARFYVEPIKKIIMKEYNYMYDSVKDSKVKDNKYYVEVMAKEGGDGYLSLYDKIKIDYSGEYDSEKILKEFYRKHPEYKDRRYYIPQIVIDSIKDETPYEEQTKELEKSEEKFEDASAKLIKNYGMPVAIEFNGEKYPIGDEPNPKDLASVRNPNGLEKIATVMLEGQKYTIYGGGFKNMSHSKRVAVEDSVKDKLVNVQIPTKPFWEVIIDGDNFFSNFFDTEQEARKYAEKYKGHKVEIKKVNPPSVHKEVKPIKKPLTLAQQMGKIFLPQDSVKDAAELSAKSIDDLDEQIKRYQKLHPNWKFGEIRKERGLYRVNVIKDSIKDAMTEYTINYKDLYHGLRDRYVVKGKNVEDALKKFGQYIALSGLGTYNAYVVSVHPDDEYLALYGRLNELLKKLNISLYDSKHIKAIKAVKAIKQHQDSKLKDSNELVDLINTLSDKADDFTKTMSNDEEKTLYSTLYKVTQDISEKADQESASKILNVSKKLGDCAKIAKNESAKPKLIALSKELYRCYDRNRKYKDSKVKDDYSGFLGNYGFGYLKGSGDYEYWYYKDKNDINTFNKVVERIRKEYPSFVVSSIKSDGNPRIYIQKSKYGVKDSKVKDIDISESQLERDLQKDPYWKNHLGYVEQVGYSDYEIEDIAERANSRTEHKLEELINKLYDEGWVEKSGSNCYLIHFRDSKVKDEYVRTPRGTFLLVNKTEEELRKEGYGYHHSGNGYKVFVKNNEAVAIKE